MLHVSEGKTLRSESACNFLHFGDATFSIFVCNFFQKLLAKNTAPIRRTGSGPPSIRRPAYRSSRAAGLRSPLSSSSLTFPLLPFFIYCYLSQIDSISQRVDAVFSGSAVQSGRDMIEQLSMTKKQVSDTIGYLQQAKEKLIRIKMI
jgi:hypothetical protein